jgi:hypothetical protein
LPRLKKHYETVAAREELARWRSRHNEVKERRDAAAANLQALYEPFVEQIVPLLLEIEQIDHAIGQVNATTPADGATKMRLEPVEIVARAPSGPNWSSIIRDLRLPHWAPHAGQAWPPHRSIDFAQLQMATRPPGDPRLASFHAYVGASLWPDLSDCSQSNAYTIYVPEQLRTQPPVSCTGKHTSPRRPSANSDKMSA